jgi:hypothetical protein
MMIIGVDIFNRDTVADHYLIGGIPDTVEHRSNAALFCDWLNTFTHDEHGGRSYITVENDYRLSRGMEDLV